MSLVSTYVIYQNSETHAQDAPQQGTLCRTLRN
jgi:hypothetical protein